MIKYLTRQLTLTMLATGMLSGCSMAPHYVRPDAPVTAAYPDVTDAQSTALASEIGWREFFPEQRLQALIATALENNRDLRTAALRIEEARAQYDIQAADLLPNLNGSASVARTRTPAQLSPSGSTTVSRTYQVGLNLASFELDFFGRVRSLNDAALSQYLATEEARRAAQIGIVAEVAKAYLAERAFAEQLALAQRTMDGRQTAYTLAKQRFDVGASSALDLRQSEILVQSARVSLLTLTRQRAQAENALTLLVGTPLNGLPPGQNLAAQSPISWGQSTASLNSFPQYEVINIPAGLPSDLLERRPDIRAAEQRLQAANANIGAARAAFFPRISLTAGFGTASTALSDLFTAGSRSWSFVPQLVVPIFDAGRNRANLSLAEVRKNIAITDYEKIIQTAFREVADALVARGTLDEQIDAQRAVQEAEVDRLRLADLRFQNGVASSLEVLDAQRELFAAEQSLVQAQLLRLTNSIDLYRSLGGGLREVSVAAAAGK